MEKKEFTDTERLQIIQIYLKYCVNLALIDCLKNPDDKKYVHRVASIMAFQRNVKDDEGLNRALEEMATDLQATEKILSIEGDIIF